MKIIQNMSQQDLNNLVAVFKTPIIIDKKIPEEDFLGPGLIVFDEQFFEIPMWLDFLLYPEDHQ